jgi:hypothetical protein
MNHLKAMIGSALVVTLLSLAPLAALGQSAPENLATPGSSSACRTEWSTQGSASAMDHTLSREIKRAWSEDKNATAAMAFQENGEIAMNEGKDGEAKQYFRAAEQELATLTSDHTVH